MPKIKEDRWLPTKRLDMRNLLLNCIIAIFLILAGAFCIQISVSAEMEFVNRGVVFSDPTHTEAMSEQWLKQPIHYQKLPENIDLSITLDQQLYPALMPLIKEFAGKHQLRIAVSEGTCGISAGALLDKNVDIGGFCCPAGETDRLPGLKYHTLGIASIALIAHPSNSTVDISAEQLRKIFRGQIGSWEKTEGNSNNTSGLSRIQPIARLHCKTRPGHWRLILDNEDDFSPTLDEVATIPDMISHVIREQGTIGYETLWMTKRYAKIGNVKLLKINGHSPKDKQAILDRLYPFYRTFNMSSWTHPDLHKSSATALINYIQDNFERVDKKYEFISAKQLRASGWRFNDEELIGEPALTK
jgi:phosphate transport system substrate-binding protein